MEEKGYKFYGKWKMLRSTILVWTSSSFFFSLSILHTSSQIQYTNNRFDEIYSFLDCPLARFLHLTDTETCHCNSERETIRTRTYQPKIYMGHDKKEQKLSNIFVGV